MMFQTSTEAARLPSGATATRESRSRSRPGICHIVIKWSDGLFILAQQSLRL